VSASRCDPKQSGKPAIVVIRKDNRSARGQDVCFRRPADTDEFEAERAGDFKIPKPVSDGNSPARRCDAIASSGTFDGGGDEIRP
jgi:hypothetical protein